MEDYEDIDERMFDVTFENIQEEGEVKRNSLPRMTDNPLDKIGRQTSEGRQTFINKQTNMDF